MVPGLPGLPAASVTISEGSRSGGCVTGAPRRCGAVCRAASKLRATLEAAARARGALEAALRALERHARADDAAAVESAAAAAEAAAGELLAEDVARAREAAARWRAAAAAEARLAHALREGSPASALARLIQARSAQDSGASGLSRRGTHVVSHVLHTYKCLCVSTGGLPAREENQTSLRRVPRANCHQRHVTVVERATGAAAVRKARSTRQVIHQV